jgi:hypothetical protein
MQVPEMRELIAVIIKELPQWVFFNFEYFNLQIGPLV